ncbi:MAG: Uma2 family endonuclease [Armatimonadetes bacterium]|nr:Uma2 family endonuclease [Armatimonadota bacterium]PIU62920.1 MAG: hypothetical protein COS85_17135 [Armatimonadetes bacterium CG07_land_8_20_14_0_80_59_28]
MSAVPQLKLTAEEFLAGERVAETKHKYLNGEVYAMAGASREHNVISGNVIRHLGNLLVGKPCEVYPSDMRLQVAETGLFTYPDIMVVCDKPVFVDDEVDTLLNPKLIVEVLSPTTEANDRGWKWAHYRQLRSLAEYILIPQDDYRVEQYSRQADDSWLYREYRGLNDSLRIPLFGCEIPLSDIFYRIELGTPGE